MAINTQDAVDLMKLHTQIERIDAAEAAVTIEMSLLLSMTNAMLHIPSQAATTTQTTTRVGSMITLAAITTIDTMQVMATSIGTETVTISITRATDTRTSRVTRPGLRARGIRAIVHMTMTATGKKSTGVMTVSRNIETTIEAGLAIVEERTEVVIGTTMKKGREGKEPIIIITKLRTLGYGRLYLEINDKVGIECHVYIFYWSYLGYSEINM